MKHKYLYLALIVTIFTGSSMLFGQTVSNEYVWKDGFLEKGYKQPQKEINSAVMLIFGSVPAGEGVITSKCMIIAIEELKEENGQITIWGVGDKKGKCGNWSGVGTVDGLNIKEGGSRIQVKVTEKDGITTVGFKVDDGDKETSQNLHKLLADKLSKEIVLADFKPTLSGHKNNAFVETMQVGPDRKEMVVFWKKDEPNYTLVAALGGAFWGDGLQVHIGSHGEKICFGEAYVAINGDSQFVANLDYDSSIYTFIGTVRLLKYTFSSDEKDPLVFKLVKDKGLVYVKGKGTITTSEGKKITVDATAK